ncbi:hypothetical protein BH10ACT1_BH10ACT1_07000 [soil metagenome]
MSSGAVVRLPGMTTTTPADSSNSAVLHGAAADAKARPLWLAVAISGLIAAVTTTALVAGAKALDVPMVAGPKSDAVGRSIPTFGFFTGTLMFTVIGLLIAAGISRWAKDPARTWTITTVVLTTVSLAGPATTGHATTATYVVLFATHIVAAAIVIPVVARNLAARP